MDVSIEDKRSGKLWWKASTAVLGFIVIILLFFFVRIVFLNDSESPKEYGVFTAKPLFDKTKAGRNENDLQDIAITLKYTTKENTERWLIDIKKQRKSMNDLPIYIYPPNNSVSEYLDVKRKFKNFDNIKVVQVFNGTVQYSDVLKNKKIEFIIEVEDTQYVGSDFADYYYLGKKIMNLDKRISCVCGGSIYETAEFLQPSQGDMFWLMDTDYCSMGTMKHRDSIDDEKPNKIPICLRSEVPRVSSNGEFVTKMSFNVAKMDPNLWTVDEFSERMDFEMKAAKVMQKLDWDDLRRHDEHLVYKFPWSDGNDLQHYFDTLENVIEMMHSRMYNGSTPLFVDGRKVYLVMEHSEDKIKEFFMF